MRRQKVRMFIKTLGSKNSQKDVSHHGDSVITNTRRISTGVEIIRQPSVFSLFSQISP